MARARKELERRDLRRRLATKGGLRLFIELFWEVVEPDRPLVWGWALDAICLHLEAVSRGEIRKLLINVPPGFAKSLCLNVFFPSWEWGALKRSSLRYLAFSYSPALTERDNGRFALILQSPKFAWLFPEVTFRPYALGVTKVANKQTGWKIASSVGGVGTGERGDRILIDDPHNVKDSESEVIRAETVRWFRESLTTRYNDQSSATIVIMQRVHEEDVSGVIISNDFGYVHLCIPMHYDSEKRCVMVWVERGIENWLDPDEAPNPEIVFWEDPRTEDGELAFPERFPEYAVERDAIALGPSATAAQFEQSPSPKGGNIILRDWWKLWPAPGYEPKDGEPLSFPLCELIVGSVDTAYGQKDENAWNAMQVWGVWRDQRERPKTILMEAWRRRVPLRGVIPEEITDPDERKKHWGLAEYVADTCRRRKISVLLIEDKTKGADLKDELYRIFKPSEVMIVMINPQKDKVARLNSVQAVFADGLVYAPDRKWSDTVIDEISTFPRGKYADHVDVASQCLSWLRKAGVLLFGYEADKENLEERTFRPSRTNRYDV